MADVQETAAAETKVDETPKAEEAKGDDAAPAENGTNGVEENGHSNGHAEPAAESTEEAPKEEAAAEEAPEEAAEEKADEPTAKKAKKSADKPKKKITEGRRSSSRLQNVLTGTCLSKEISSDNLPKGAR